MIKDLYGIDMGVGSVPNVEERVSAALDPVYDRIHAMCESLLDDFKKLWTFSRISGMEPTNNMAEGDLRKLVIWRRKSYGTRSDRGKRFVERVTTTAQTIRKQSGNVLRFIQQAVECFYMRALPPLISEAMGF